MRSSSRSTKAHHRSSGSSSREKSSFRGTELPAELAQTKTASGADTLRSLSVRAEHLPRTRSRKRARVRLLWQWGLLAGSLVVLSVTVLGLAFAGSPERLPAGARVGVLRAAGLAT